MSHSNYTPLPTTDANTAFQQLRSPSNDSDVSDEGFDFSTRQSASKSLKRRWRELSTQFLAHVDANAGLLLVASSQFFFSLMNLVAKKVNTVDPPVPTLEVRPVLVSCFFMKSNSRVTAYFDTNGQAPRLNRAVM